MNPGREPFIVAKRRVSAQMERIPKGGEWQDHHFKRVVALWHYYPDQVEATTRMLSRHLKTLPMHQKSLLWRRLMAMTPTPAVTAAGHLFLDNLQAHHLPTALAELCRANPSHPASSWDELERSWATARQWAIHRDALPIEDLAIVLAKDLLRVAIVYTEAEPCLTAMMGDCARPKAPMAKSWVEQWWRACQSSETANGRVLDVLLAQGVDMEGVNEQGRAAVDLMLAEMETGIDPVSFLPKPVSDLDVALVGLIAERMGAPFLEKLYAYPKARTTLMARGASVRRLSLAQLAPAEATEIARRL